MKQYSGKKQVQKWIDDNIFRIHEYSVSKNTQTYQELVVSLNEILKNKRYSILINQRTKYKDQIIITYTPSGDMWTAGRYRLNIYEDKVHTIKN